MASSLQAGASGPLSAFNRIRACSKVRAATLPRRVNGKSWACSSGVNRTTYFFMTEDLETEKAVGAAFFQAIPGYSTQQVIRDAPLGVRPSLVGDPTLSNPTPQRWLNT